ncbi:MAG: hypothetical protein NTX40_00080 [Planctomycetota bacterium]|nr:hypothetical protein [Planctomycetota bacterium]
MTAFRVLLRMVLAVTLLAAGAQVAFGWPGLSHVLITQEAGYNNLRFYANLPDTYPSMVELMPSRFFAWTHNRLTGTGWATPTPGVEDPAVDMWLLLKNKLNALQGNEKTVAENTALGWRAHIAADDVVHFEYFPGGGVSGINWLQHARMEAEVDILVYVEKICENNLAIAFNVTFDAQGNRNGGNGNVNRGFAIQWPGHWGLISLAESVYLKNQRRTDITEPETIWPEPAATVQTRANNARTAAQTTINNWEFEHGGVLDMDWTNEYTEAVIDYGQLLTQNAGAGATVLHVKHMYPWEVGEQVRIYTADGSAFETRTITAIDRANRTVTVNQGLTNAYTGNGAAGSDYVMYMPDDDWLPWEPRWEASVQAVQQQVAGLQGQ